MKIYSTSEFFNMVLKFVSSFLILFQILSFFSVLTSLLFVTHNFRGITANQLSQILICHKIWYLKTRGI